MTNKLQQKFDSYPVHIKPLMLQLRKLIFEVARTTDGVGEIEETLKWGEPAFIPSKTKSGTTIRMDWKAKNPDYIGIYVSCNTSLIDSYKTLFSEELEFEGKRAIFIPINNPIPEKELKICFQMALRYHLDK